MDTAQWAQKNMEGPISKNSNPTVEKKARPQKDCPRCNSRNTKFCYYNNYSLSQPRYFCKTCRRYWTEGGSLRNVPVGGGSRKNKRPSPSSSTNKLNNNNNNNNNTNIPPTKIHQPQDLNLAYPPPSDLINDLIPSSSTTTNTTSSSRGLGISSFMPTMSYGSTGFGLQDFKPPPGLTFSLEGFENNGYGGISGIQETSGARMLFPMEDLKHQVPTTTDHDHHHYDHQNRSHADSTGFWNGMLGGGSW